MDNTNYSPVKPNFYNYISNKLEKNIDELLRQIVINKLEIDEIIVCAYNVNNEGVYPFLQFLLVNDMCLTFPHIPINFNEINTKQLIKLVTFLLFSLTQTDSLENFSDKLRVDGFCVFKDALCVFIDLTENKLNLNDIYLNSLSRFVLIDEIVNRKHMCNMKISHYVTEFFKYNYDYCVLTNENGDVYETPIVSYAGRQENMLNFTYVFGVSKKDKSAILGPYHYFTDFNGAIRESSYNDDLGINKRPKSGIVRFAVFTKNIKYIENLPNDPIDTSETKAQRLLDNKLDTFMERLSMRVSDHDGKWADNYDGCYLGETLLDNGTVMKNQNLLVIKEYNQQIPLSYHYVDNTLLGEKYDESVEYKIM